MGARPRNGAWIRRHTGARLPAPPRQIQCSNGHYRPPPRKSEDPTDLSTRPVRIGVGKDITRLSDVPSFAKIQCRFVSGGAPSAAACQWIRKPYRRTTPPVRLKQVWLLMTETALTIDVYVT